MSEYGEPWTVYDKAPQLVNASGQHILELREVRPQEHDGRVSIRVSDPDPDQLRRIVACVNACAGTPTDVLESHHHGIVDQLLRADHRCRTVVDQPIHEQIADFAEELTEQVIAYCRSFLKSGVTIRGDAGLLGEECERVARDTARKYAAQRFPLAPDSVAQGA